MKHVERPSIFIICKEAAWKSEHETFDFREKNFAHGFFMKFDIEELHEKVSSHFSF
jgi:hypothetical protein